ncbi:MAG TPA: DUF1737 domain-containing protein [Anaerolineaceae bacterium]
MPEETPIYTAVPAVEPARELTSVPRLSYLIVASVNPDILSRKVTAAINDGWELCGGPITSVHGEYAQALWRDNLTHQLTRRLP